MKEETSLYEAIYNKDEDKIKELNKKADKGEIIRII